MIYDRVNYTAQISYLTNTFVTEYDISKANINVLYLKGVLDKQTYDYLYEQERMVRQRYVGMMQKNDKEITKILKQGIIEAKQALFQANNIQDYEVLMIKNDAVFIINRSLQITDFGLIKFLPKNVYTSFYKIDTKISKLELLYYYSNLTKEERLDIKGLSDEIIEWHKDSFYQVLKDLFYSVQTNGIEVALRMMKDIYMQYITLSFPVEYYRTFNNYNTFHLKSFSSIGTGFNIDSVTEDMKPILDISYNLHILLEIQKLLVSIYFNR